MMKLSIVKTGSGKGVSDPAVPLLFTTIPDPEHLSSLFLIPFPFPIPLSG